MTLQELQLKILFIFYFFKPTRAIGVVGKHDWTKVQGHWEGPLFLEEIKQYNKVLGFNCATHFE